MLLEFYCFVTCSLRPHIRHLYVVLFFRKKIFIGSYSGLLQIWDYENREVIASRKFERGAMIQCVDIDPKGYYIGTIYN